MAWLAGLKKQKSLPKSSLCLVVAAIMTRVGFLCELMNVNIINASGTLSVPTSQKQNVSDHKSKILCVSFLGFVVDSFVEDS